MDCLLCHQVAGQLHYVAKLVHRTDQEMKDTNPDKSAVNVKVYMVTIVEFDYMAVLVESKSSDGGLENTTT